MRFTTFILLICLISSAFIYVDAKDGGGCAACVIALGLFEQLALVRKAPVRTVLTDWCKAVLSTEDPTLSTICSVGASIFAPVIQNELNKQISPEKSCSTVYKSCENYPQCKLFDSWPPKSLLMDMPKNENDYFFQVDEQEYNNSLQAMESPDFIVMKSTIERYVIKLLQKLHLMNADYKTTTAELVRQFSSVMDEQQKDYNDDMLNEAHLPIVDIDKDNYSATVGGLRGFNWRGRDCDDKNSNVYPGRKIPDEKSSANVDHNCNGIYGFNPSTEKSYEEELCSGTKQYGLISLGDSATAHFAIPPDFLNPKVISQTTYKTLIDVAINEADFPHCSSSTGFADEKLCPKSYANYTSIYKKMVERNRCMHRDYQNNGVNGGASDNMAPPNGIITSLTRNQKLDHPAVVIYAVIGNDICSSSPSVSAMTTEEEFEANTIKSLEYLDNKLPAGSIVVLGSVIDGRVLYNNMHNLTHPIGTTYSSVYDFLNCIHISPCAAWLNSDENIRNAATAHAQKLSARYPKIIRERGSTYKNFNLYHIPYDTLLNGVVEKWTKYMGRPGSQLIEHTDGFHPSTTAQSLIGEAVWNYMIDVLKLDIPINPNNDKIKMIFGDQGGY